MQYNLASWGQRLYFPSEGSLATDFIALKNTSSSAGFKPVNLWFNEKYDNYYTTENDLLSWFVCNSLRGSDPCRALEWVSLLLLSRQLGTNSVTIYGSTLTEETAGGR
jgi:hypothetical protein